MWSTFGDAEEEDHEEVEELVEVGFLSLPSELITRIFSYLCIADRLNARVNQRLNEVEKKGKFSTKKLHIEMEVRFAWKTFKDRALRPQNGVEYKYHLHNEFEDLASLERVFSNTTFEAVHVKFHEDRPIYRRLTELIRDCGATELSMEIEDRRGALGDDSLLLDLFRNRKKVVFKSYNTARLLERGFQRVYQAILDRSIDLEILEIHGYACRFVLESIGLHIGTPQNAELFLSPDPAQFAAYEGGEDFIIFHKNMRMRFPSGFSSGPQSRVYFQIYENEEKIEAMKDEIKDRLDFIVRPVHRLA